jgi:tetratricopeptide (TPR) repeat protein
MSGGAVLNNNGELVAIHGVGDRDEDGRKNGFNLGIPIERFGTVANRMGVSLNGQVAVIAKDTAPKADDYFAAGVQKYQKGDYQRALSDFNQAISIDPKNSATYYYNRGRLKQDKLNDTQGALADYNRAIQINPNYADTYSNRGRLKQYKLNDRAGGINDMKQAAKLYQQQGDTNRYQYAIDLLKKWQQTSGN